MKVLIQFENEFGTNVMHDFDIPHGGCLLIYPHVDGNEVSVDTFDTEEPNEHSNVGAFSIDIK